MAPKGLRRLTKTKDGEVTNVFAESSPSPQEYQPRNHTVVISNEELAQLVKPYHTMSKV